MSIIQAALEKIKSTTDTVTTTAAPSATEVKPAPSVHIRRRMIFDERLEKKLKEVQRRAIKLSLFEWKVGVGVGLLILALLAIPFFRKSSVSQNSSDSFGSASALAPAAPVANALFSMAAYRLSGITDFGDGPRAVINEQIVGVGDRVSKTATVKEIRGKEVLLEANGKDLLLKM